MRTNRRRWLALAVAGALACGVATAARAAPPVVTLFGDSIMAGYGLSPADGMAAQVQTALAALGVQAEVRNAGVPGDTSAGGLGRLSGAVRKDTTVCVVEFGGNDRRLFAASQTHDYLDAIVKRLKARGVTVILVAVGGGEQREVARQVAEANGVTLFPDLFAGVGPDLRQPDGVHPNAAGEKLIAGRLAPVVARALRGVLPSGPSSQNDTSLMGTVGACVRWGIDPKHVADAVVVVPSGNAELDRVIPDTIRAMEWEKPTGDYHGQWIGITMAVSGAKADMPLPKCDASRLPRPRPNS